MEKVRLTTKQDGCKDEIDSQMDKSYGTMRHVHSGKNSSLGRCAAEHRPLARLTVRPCSSSGVTDRHPDKQNGSVKGLPFGH